MCRSNLCKILLTQSRTLGRSASAMPEELMDESLRAVADPTRRAILRLVRDGELPAGEIAMHFPSISRPAVSQHLRVLSDAGLVDVRPVGNRRLYRWRRAGLRDAAALLEEMSADRLGRLKIAAEREGWPERARAAQRERVPQRKARSARRRLGALPPAPGCRRMSVDVETSILIARPLADVAEFAADPSNAPEWYVNIESVQWKSAPPAQVGSLVEFVAHFLGRTLRYTY